MQLVDFFREHRGGASHDMISAKLEQLIEHVVSEEKGGKLSITISIKPRGRGDEGAYDVDVDSALTLPKPPAMSSVLYATPEGHLTRTNPHQQELELREIAPSSPHRSLG